MSSEIRKAPSRIKYEDANPVVSFRVSRQVKALLDKVRFEQNASYADLILEGARLRECEQNDALKCVKLGICSECGQPMLFNLTNQNDINIIIRAINSAGIIHRSCRR